MLPFFRGFVLNAKTDEFLRAVQTVYTEQEKKIFREKRAKAEVSWKCHSCFDWDKDKQEYVRCGR